VYYSRRGYVSIRLIHGEIRAYSKFISWFRVNIRPETQSGEIGLSNNTLLIKIISGDKVLGVITTSTYGKLMLLFGGYSESFILPMSTFSQHIFFCLG